MNSDLSRVKGADVYVIFVESYGAISYQRPEIASKLDAVRERQGDPLVDAVRDLLRRVGARLRRGGSASDEERSV